MPFVKWTWANFPSSGAMRKKNLNLLLQLSTSSAAKYIVEIT